MTPPSQPDFHYTISKDAERQKNVPKLDPHLLQPIFLLYKESCMFFGGACSGVLIGKKNTREKFEQLGPAPWKTLQEPCPAHLRVMKVLP